MGPDPNLHPSLLAFTPRPKTTRIPLLDRAKTERLLGEVRGLGRASLQTPPNHLCLQNSVHFAVFTGVPYELI